MQIIKGYTPNGRFNDNLGELFMKCNLGCKSAGQFFTSYHISEFMARAVMDETLIREKTVDDGVITICDPCCGGGGMLVAALDVLRSCGVNYARNCFPSSFGSARTISPTMKFTLHYAKQ